MRKADDKSFYKFSITIILLTLVGTPVLGYYLYRLTYKKPTLSLESFSFVEDNGEVTQAFLDEAYNKFDSVYNCRDRTSISDAGVLLSYVNQYRGSKGVKSLFLSKTATMNALQKAICMNALDLYEHRCSIIEGNSNVWPFTNKVQRGTNENIHKGRNLNNERVMFDATPVDRDGSIGWTLHLGHNTSLVKPDLDGVSTIRCDIYWAQSFTKLLV